MREGAGAAAGAAFLVSDLAIREGSIVYIDQRSGRSARFGIDARLSSERAPGSEGALQGRGTIELSSIRTLTPEAGADSVAIPDLEIGYALFADLPGDSLALQELQLDMAGISAGGSGVVRGLMHERSIGIQCFALVGQEWLDVVFDADGAQSVTCLIRCVSGHGRDHLSLVTAVRVEQLSSDVLRMWACCSVVRCECGNHSSDAREVLRRTDINAGYHGVRVWAPQ